MLKWICILAVVIIGGMLLVTGKFEQKSPAVSAPAGTPAPLAGAYVAEAAAVNEKANSLSQADALLTNRVPPARDTASQGDILAQ